MPAVVKKAIEMSDVQISFLSLVDKAANKHEFLIMKNKDGKPQVKFSANILKSDSSTHEITGIVYEPFVADAHDNFMTAEEIQKAADWFNENGLGADMQHNNSVVDGVTIVKSWVTEEDTTVAGKVVKAGTWLATAKIENDDIWQKIEKGEITGWSMGGVGEYSTTDVDLATVEKNLAGKILSGIAKAFGFTWDGTSLEDTTFNEQYEKANKQSKFWNAWNTLQDFLIPFDDTYSWATHFQDNKEVITSALQDFSDAIKEVLGANDVAKAIEPPKDQIAKALVNKAGKKMSNENLSKLGDIVNSLNEFKASFETAPEEGDEIVKAEDIKKAVGEAIAEALAPIQKELDTLKGASTVEKAEEVTAEKADEQVDVAEIVKAAMAEALAPVQKDISTLKAAKGISKQLEGDDPEVVEVNTVNKSVFAGVFNKK